MSVIIQLDHISKTYGSGDTAVHALRDVSLGIEAGDFVAVMGASGSGKSTMMNVIGCLDRATSGRYVLDGRDVSQLPAADLADVRNQLLGFVFQSFNLLPRTSAQENVELPMVYGGVSARERRERSLAALARVGLAERSHHHPNELSGGQQQRVAIARAIVSRPRVIVADEPTGALDSRTTVEIMKLFQELGKTGITVVLVTHEPDVAAYAARLIVMKDGEVSSDTRHEPKEAVVPPAPTLPASAS